MYDKIEITDNGRGIVYRIADRKSESTYISVEKIEDVPAPHQCEWSRLHSHDYYFVVWFFEDRGVHIIDFNEYFIESNKIFFLSPGQFHQCRDIQDQEGFVITFSTDFLNNINREVKEIIRQQVFSSSSDVSPVSKIPEQDIVRIKGDIQRIEEAILNYEDCVTKKYYLASLLSLFMLDVIHYGQKEKDIERGKSNEFNIYLRFIDAVEDSFMKLHNAKDYEEKVGVSLNTMKKCVYNVSGKSPSLLINERIATEAKRMLYERTNMRVGEISEALGFEDNSNFVKFFRRYTGMTPNAFREQF